MNRLSMAGLAWVASIALTHASHAQVAGATTVGVAVAELREVALGWSAKKQILGQTIYNEQGERVGKVDDLIIAPDKAVSFVIVGAGGFVGLKRHQIAVPVQQLSLSGSGQLLLVGATKAVIKSLPAFEYERP